MGGIIVKNAVVDLIGQNKQHMFPGHFDNLFEHLR